MNVVLHYPEVDAEYKMVSSAYYLRVRQNVKSGKIVSRPTYNNVPLSLGRGGDEVKSWIYGLPDVWRYRAKSTGGKPDTIELNADKQHWLLKINVDVLVNRVLTKNEYFQWFDSQGSLSLARELTSALTHDRSHTNYMGMDNCKNYLLGSNMDKGLPKFSQIITGGSIGRVVMEDGQPMKRNLSPDGLCIAFDCINSQSDLWQYSPLNQWWLFERPAISGRSLVSDKSGVRIVKDGLLYPYPHFSNKLVFPLWLNQDSTAWISLSNADVFKQTGRVDKTWRV